LIGDRFDQTGEERANLSATLIKRTMLAIDGRHDACQHLQFFRKNSSASAYAAKLNMCIDTTLMCKTGATTHTKKIFKLSL